MDERHNPPGAARAGESRQQPEDAEDAFARRIAAVDDLSERELRRAMYYLSGRAPAFFDEALGRAVAIRAEASR